MWVGKVNFYQTNYDLLKEMMSKHGGEFIVRPYHPGWSPSLDLVEAEVSISSECLEALDCATGKFTWVLTYKGDGHEPS